MTSWVFIDPEGLCARRRPRHLAVVVDDVDAEHARSEAEHIQAGPLRDLKHQSSIRARFFATDSDGYKNEVIRRGGRFV